MNLPDQGTKPPSAGPDERIRGLRTPWASDPVFWVSVGVSLVAGVAVAIWIASPVGTSAYLVPMLMGLGAACVAWAFTVTVATVTRRAMSERRRARLLRSRPSSTAAGWQPDPVNLNRYRWWSGTEWAAEVSPAPSRAGIGRAGPLALGAAALAVVLSGLLMESWSIDGGTSTPDSASGQENLVNTDQATPLPSEPEGGASAPAPSPSPTPVVPFDPKLTADLANAYGDMSKRFFAVSEFRPSDSDRPIDLALNYRRKISKAEDAWTAFNKLLGQARRQEQIGDFPPLGLLRQVDFAMSMFFRTADKSTMDMIRCMGQPEYEVVSCLETSQATYEGRFQKEYDAVVNAIQAVADAQKEYQS